MAKANKQLQVTAAAGFIGCLALYILVQFVIVPLIADLRSTRREIGNAYAELDSILKTVRARPSMLEQIDEVLAKLKNQAEQIPLPVLGNYIIGMEEAVRTCLEGTGVDIITVVEAGEPVKLPGGSGTFKVFQTRVVSTAGLHDLARALEKIERSYPCASVSGVIISARDDDPDLHSVTFVVSWLIWSDPAQRPSFLTDAS